MKREGSAPGREGSEEPGPGAQVAIVLEQLEERVAGGPEKAIREPLAARLPEAEQLVGNGEDHVVVIARRAAAARASP